MTTAALAPRLTRADESPATRSSSRPTTRDTRKGTRSTSALAAAPRSEEYVRERAFFYDIPCRGMGIVNEQGAEMSDVKRYSVPGMHCAHCKGAVTGELRTVSGVEHVDVDLETKIVTVSGTRLDDSALRAAIDEAGYEAEEVAA
jgi:copper chaperone